MVILSFTLQPEAVVKFQDVLVCLGKFSEAVSIEARRDQLNLSALNSSKSAYASFAFEARKFFTKYSYNPPRTNGVPQEKFTCKIYNKALSAVFKGRAADPLREKDTGIEKCEVSVEDGAGEVKSRFVVKMICRHGVLKLYRLTFEPTPPAYVSFDAAVATNRWEISSRTLREFVEHFGPGTEHLDMYAEDGRVTFTSYTEKIVSGTEVLKQPLQTSIAIDSSEFSQFSVEEKLHVAISVKDFKAIITHAGITNNTVGASYSYPSRPLRLKYSEDGMSAEFILTTIGDFRSSSTTPAVGAARAGSRKAAPRQPLGISNIRRSPERSMQPPPRPGISNMSRESSRYRIARPSPPPPQPSIEANVMFFTEEDDDRRWDPVGSDDEREEAIGWGASADNDAKAASISGTLQNYSSHSQSINGHRREEWNEQIARLPPTQRMSQIHGLFD